MFSHQDMESLYAHFYSIDGYDVQHRSAARSPLSHYSFFGDRFTAAGRMISAAAPAENRAFSPSPLSTVEIACRSSVIEQKLVPEYMGPLIPRRRQRPRSVAIAAPLTPDDVVGLFEPEDG
ncbi:hypothetical protein DL771_009902 [Monosporascus sp. 5C6A]|nr:hypothetical protein DL771_009902 [Monosporascus sp. 5C6A]